MSTEIQAAQRGFMSPTEHVWYAPEPGADGFYNHRQPPDPKNRTNADHPVESFGTRESAEGCARMILVRGMSLQSSLNCGSVALQSDAHSGFGGHSADEIFSWLDMTSADLGAAATALGFKRSWIERVSKTGRFFYFDRFEIHPAHRRQGYGKEFCRDFISLALGRYRCDSFLFRAFPMQYAGSGKPHQVVDVGEVAKATRKLGFRYMSWLPGLEFVFENPVTLWMLGTVVAPLPKNAEGNYQQLKRIYWGTDES